jgi:parvulin-like peptidyl-prolyl isomerase
MCVQFTPIFLICLFTASTRGQDAPRVPSTESPGFIAANVNGEPITIEDVDAALNSSLPGTPLTPSQKRDLRRALLEDLIDEKLIRVFLAKNAPKVEAAELDAHFAAFKASLIRENTTLEEYYRRTKQNEAQLRDEWRARIQLTHYAKQRATDERLKAFHEEHRDYFDKVEVRLSHIQILAGQNASPVDRGAAKEKLQRIRTEISSGRLSFPLAARKYSQCPSALKNGDLGFIPRRGLPEDEPLARAAFALSVGGLSEVIETNRGLHLVTVTDRKRGTRSVLEKCVAEVFEVFVEETRAELIKKLRSENSVRIMLP